MVFGNGLPYEFGRLVGDIGLQNLTPQKARRRIGSGGPDTSEMLRGQNLKIATRVCGLASMLGMPMPAFWLRQTR